MMGSCKRSANSAVAIARLGAQVRFAGPGIALDQEPRGEQFGEVEERGALARQAEIDVGTHGAS